MLPIENSTAGPVLGVVDLLLEHGGAGRLAIVAQHMLPIEHCLFSHAKDVSDVREVISHAQALAQSAAWLGKHAPLARHTTCSSTALAVKQVADAGAATSIAAVGAAIAGDVHCVPLLHRGIQDAAEGNVTRFVVVAPAAHAAAVAVAGIGPLRCAAVLALQLPALPVVLSALRRAGLEVAMLVSRPTPNAAWGTRFYTEMRLAGGQQLSRVQDKLAQELGSDVCTLTWVGHWAEFDDSGKDGKGGAVGHGAPGKKRKR